MMNEHVVIIGMALLIYWLIWGGRIGWIAAMLSAIMMVGALRHPEIAPSGRQMEGTPEEQLQIVMLMVALILFPPLVWWWVKGLFQRGRQ
jgi:hypothetical protein